MLGEFAVATTSLVIIKPLRCWCVNLLRPNRDLSVNFMLLALLSVEPPLSRRLEFLCICFLVVKLLNLLRSARDMYTFTE